MCIISYVYFLSTIAKIVFIEKKSSSEKINFGT